MAKSNDATFGGLLKLLRRKAGLTQGDLASRVGYSTAMISRLEADERLPDPKLVREHIVGALGIDGDATLAARLVALAEAASSTQFTQPNQPTQPLSNLPAPPDALIGREGDVVHAVELAVNHIGRLVTLVGPPGVGKTRLALATAAHAQAAFADGARFVSLNTAMTTADMISSILDVLQADGEVAQSSLPPDKQLVQLLRRKHLLLVLDNLEQLLSPSSDASQLLAQVLAECPRVHVLATSREPVRIRAERVIAVRALREADAVALFCERAQAVNSALALDAQVDAMATLCAQLDHLPLAIELAAARCDVFTPLALLKQLDRGRLSLLSDGSRDLPDHQRTLTDAIAWSYRLLDARCQQAFARLSVFAGSFTLDFAQSICDVQPEHMRTLVQKNLVRSEPQVDGEARFSLLETLREFAAMQLEQDDQTAALRERHCAHCVAWLDEVHEHVRGHDGQRWLARLTLDHPNIRAAQAWCLRQHTLDQCYGLTGSLERFWLARNHIHEADGWLQQVMALPAPLILNERLLRLRSRALRVAGLFARMVGDLPRGLRWQEDSLQLAYGIEEPEDLYEALQCLAASVHAANDLPRAAALYAECAQVRKSHPDVPTLKPMLLNPMMLLEAYGGNYALAREAADESVAQWRAEGDLVALSLALIYQGELARHQHDDDAARRSYEDALAVSQSAHYDANIGWSQHNLGHLALRHGDADEATRLFQASASLFQTLGHQLGLASCLAGLASAQADATEAARLFDQSDSILRRINQSLDPVDAADCAPHRARVMG